MQSRIEPMEISHDKTNRHFDILFFKDRYSVECSMQKSSLATEDAIWIGCNDPEPRILASKTKQGGTGWVDYPLPDDVSCNTRMHLTRRDVWKLLPHIVWFVLTGNVK